MSEEQADDKGAEAAKNGSKSVRKAKIRSKIIESILSSDAKLNAAFDRMVIGDLVAEEKRSRLQNRGRRHGRPHGGKIVFDVERIKALPMIGCSALFARTLGVRLASVQQWCNLEKCPLPSVSKDGSKILRKDIVVAWLIKTGRYKGESVES